MKRLARLGLFLSIVVCSGILHAQQPQTSDAPIFRVNAKFVQGVGPGYWPQAGAGLTLNIAAGTVDCAHTMTTYAAGTLTMANNTTNYVYLDTTASCAPASNTSGFTATTIPIATVVTSSGVITTITDDRTLFRVSTTTGAVSVTGSPSAGNLAKFSGPLSITNGDISGDCTTSGALLLTCTFINGNSFPSGVANHQVAVGTAANTFSFKTIPDCTDTGGNHINFTQSTNAFSCGTTSPSSSINHGLSFSIGIPGGTALTTASTTTRYLTVPFACTISAYNLLIDAGTITVKFWKVATGTAIPTSGNSINTSGVGISSGTAIHSTTLSDFTTTAVAANDIMAMNVTAVSSAAYVNGVLKCDQ